LNLKGRAIGLNVINIGELVVDAVDVVVEAVVIEVVVVEVVVVDCCCLD